jgi:hypothetical protein
MGTLTFTTTPERRGPALARPGDQLRKRSPSSSQ